ncbi:MAG: 2-amino-4-hydroxy-6-hydroxymethyldihydropteridine diphosphokinase, partial [Sphingopyxis sp.]|nr:2-amino-4-hydroxy-6-hydroxymethyldihydropteridine diphosphokinase [Sphingopyxis sp.]
SPVAHPPIMVAATAIATSERRAFRFIVPDRLSTINTTLVHPAGPDTLDPKNEAAFGRRTGQRWSARTLDLDILLWSGGIWSDSALTIPHPAIEQRAFVLGPLRAIVPEWQHPLHRRSVRQLAARLARPKPVDRGAAAH